MKERAANSLPPMVILAQCSEVVICRVPEASARAADGAVGASGGELRAEIDAQRAEFGFGAGPARLYDSIHSSIFDIISVMSKENERVLNSQRNT